MSKKRMTCEVESGGGVTVKILHPIPDLKDLYVGKMIIILVYGSYHLGSDKITVYGRFLETLNDITIACQPQK